MLFRCRICDEEYTILEVVGILDDDLCPECENTVLETMAEWEAEEPKGSHHSAEKVPESQCAAHTEAVGGSQVPTGPEEATAIHGEHNGSSGREEKAS